MLNVSPRDLDAMIIHGLEKEFTGLWDQELTFFKVGVKYFKN